VLSGWIRTFQGRYTQIPYTNNNNNLSVVPNVKISECIEQCNNNPQCMGFSVPASMSQSPNADMMNNPNARGNCVLKNNFNDRQANNDFHMYAKNNWD
jgi:hypothetical protein